jgi:hypothetical protein
MILKIFSPNFSTKKLAFFTQNKGKLFKILIITSVFEKNANFFAENCQKIAENYGTTSKVRMPTCRMQTCRMQTL